MGIAAVLYEENFLQAPFKPTGDKCLILERVWMEYHFTFYCPLKQHSSHCVLEQCAVLSFISATTKSDTFIEFEKWL